MIRDLFNSIRKKGLTAVVFCAAAFCVYAEVSFESPDLNENNQLVFNVTHSISGSPSYSTGFMADASTLSGIRILTCYPEKMEVLSKGAVLQIRNRYGSARYSTADNTISWIKRTDSIPSFSSKQEPQSVSPDGKWICYIKKTQVSSGELILKNASTMQETVLNKHAEFDFERVPVLWNPESTSLLYEKGDSIYFCDPKAAFQKVQMSEDFRKIGKGSIAGVCWANSKNLIYLDRDLVYRISSNELYTRALYSKMVGSGTVIGRLPVKFDGRYDKFSVNVRGDSLVLIQGDKIVSLFKIAGDGFEYLQSVYSKPVTDIGGTIIDIDAFWSADSKCLLWVNSLGYEDGTKKASVYSLGADLKFLAIIEGASKPVLSEDSKKLCYAQGNSLFVYDTSSWQMIDRLDGEPIVSFAWSGNSKIYAGGVSTVREWIIGGSNLNRVLFLSSCARVFWKSSSAVCAQDSHNPKIFYDMDLIAGTWKPVESSDILIVGDGRLQNGRYRVFISTTPNQKFANSLYIRTLSGKAVTNPLFPDTAVKSDSLKKVALVIDLLDDASGLSRVLATLKEYNVPATFFVNGEFIRRYPKETKQIAKSGFNAGSMFFTNADLTTKGFVVDEDFIRRGLARNEDEFYAATGKELSLLWHAPFYKSNDSIKKSGEACGYRYVEAGRFSLDTITLEEAALGRPGYLSASQMISFYAENATSLSVIPVSTGISSGSRTDYLYEKLDLLIGTLINEEYEIVDVTEL